MFVTILFGVLIALLMLARHGHFMLTKQERQKVLSMPYPERVRNCIIFLVLYQPIVFREWIHPWGDIYIAAIIVLVGFSVLMKLTPKI